MYRILTKKSLNYNVTQMEIDAPLVAAKAKPGQFIILRVDQGGERIPLTVAGIDKEKGSVKIVFKVAGSTTQILHYKEVGDSLCDFAGPLGNPTRTDGLKNVCVIGGGVGCAIALPVAKELKEKDARVTGIAGFKNEAQVLLEEEFRECCDDFYLMTDDGSRGAYGNVTLPLKELLEKDERFDEIIAIGPVVMMKFVTLVAKPFGIPVTVSMNPIMIDGTGMCGGCRLTLNKDGRREIRFACVDGPDFDGYEVDFEEALNRSRMYKAFESHAYEETCHLFSKIKD